VNEVKQKELNEKFIMERSATLEEALKMAKCICNWKLSCKGLELPKRYIERWKKAT